MGDDGGRARVGDQWEAEAEAEADRHQRRCRWFASRRPQARASDARQRGPVCSRRCRSIPGGSGMGAPKGGLAGIAAPARSVVRSFACSTFTVKSAIRGSKDSYSAAAASAVLSYLGSSAASCFASALGRAKLREGGGKVAQLHAVSAQRRGARSGSPRRPWTREIARGPLDIFSWRTDRARAKSASAPLPSAPRMP